MTTNLYELVLVGKRYGFDLISSGMVYGSVRDKFIINGRYAFLILEENGSSLKKIDACSVSKLIGPFK